MPLNPYNIHYVKPYVIDTGWLRNIYEQTFHKQKEVQYQVRKLYPNGLDKNGCQKYEEQIQHVLCQTFEFVPYRTLKDLGQLLELGKESGLTIDDFTTLPRSQVSETTAILKKKQTSINL